MKIYGLQKMTLLDFPGHVACTVFLGGCDFRCPFCHNYELACGKAPSVMEEEELLGFLEKRKGLLEGVAITGGEPCLEKDLPQLMRRIRGMGFGVKLDTNGYHPAMLRSILEEGLADYVAMDIKNRPEKYAPTCGVAQVDPERIRESIRLIMTMAPDYEFRTTLVRQFHEAEDIPGMGGMIRGARRYALQLFTDRELVPYAGLSAPSREEVLAWLELARPFAQEVLVRGME